MSHDDDDEFCAECGDSEFDDEGNETHADEKRYDHDFVYEKDEDEESELTLDDVKKVADTASSVFKAVKTFKDITDDSKSYHETSTPRPSTPEQKRPGVWGRYILRPIKAKSGTDVRLDRIEKKIDHGHKSQNKKWYVAIGIGLVITVIAALLF